MATKRVRVTKKRRDGNTVVVSLRLKKATLRMLDEKARGLDRSRNWTADSVLASALAESQKAAG